MNTPLNEEKLLAQFRNLGPEGQQELLDFAALLGQKNALATNGGAANNADRCALKKDDKRPESAAEPIFTE